MRLRPAIGVFALLLVAPAAVADHSTAPVIFTVAGTGTGGAGGSGPPSLTQLNGPVGLLADPTRPAYWIGDTINQRVRRAGALTSLFAGIGSAGDRGDGGRAVNAALQDPTALEVHPRGVLIADTANDRVRIVGHDGIIRAFAGGFEQGFAGDGGPAATALLNGPQGLEAAADGTVFIADTGNHRIRAVAPDGTIRTVAGAAQGFDGDGGPATQASLNAPRGLALAADGALLVADSGNHRVRRIGPDGVIATVAGNGAAASGGDGGPAGAAGLNRPSDVAVAADGSVFVAETGGNRVRRIAPDGTIGRFAGAGGPRYRGDGGNPAGALLNAPRGVEVLAGSPGVLIADTDNNAIRYVTTPGVDQALMAIAPVRRTMRARLLNGRVAPTVLGVQLSRRARVTVTVTERRGRRVARFTAAGTDGLNRIALPRRLRAGARRLTKGRYNLRLGAWTSGFGRAFSTMELTVK